MSRTKITKRFLDSLKAGLKDVFYRDTELPGFGVKVAKSGTVTFIAEGRIKGGNTKRVSLGKHPTVSLDYARGTAQDALQLMKTGLDPSQVAKEESAQKAKEAAVEAAKRVTLSTVFDEYLSVRNLKPKTTKDYRNTFSVCLSDWLGKPVPSITRKMVEERFIRIRDKQGLGQASKCMRILSAVMKYSKAVYVDDDVFLIRDNPCEILSQKGFDRTLKPRNRFLDREQLRLVMEELSHVGHPQYQEQQNRLTNITIADFLMLLIFTGLRRSEAARIKWEDVKLSDGYFVVHDTKNGTDHAVPMSSRVKIMFQRRYDADERHDEWVFPDRGGNGPLQEPRAQMAKLTQITGVEFNCHDLRRTFATLADSYGLDQASVKRALNHKTQDITAQYIQTRIENLRHVFDGVEKQIMWWAFDEPELTPKQQKKLDKKMRKMAMDDDEFEDDSTSPSQTR